MKSTREYLSKLLPGFNTKPKPTTRKRQVRSPSSPAIQHGVVAPLPANQPVVKPPGASAHVEQPTAMEMLDAIMKFLRQYLVCDEHQFTILALWIVHTWSFRHFPTAAYLHIRSAEPQSAKTLCLKLLSILSDSSWFATGAHWRSVMDNLLTSGRRLNPGKPLAVAPPYAILLDDCHHTLAKPERQPLLALLNSGSQADCNYVNGLARYSVFGPKAFAGNCSLPRSLAARCIPILLPRKKPSLLFPASIQSRLLPQPHLSHSHLNPGRRPTQPPSPTSPIKRRPALLLASARANWIVPSPSSTSPIVSEALGRKGHVLLLLLPSNSPRIACLWNCSLISAPSSSSERTPPISPPVIC